MVSPGIQLKNLLPRQISALKRKAKRLGVSAEAYVKELIENDLALDRKAHGTSFDELAAPFRKGLGGTTEEEMDQLVERARGTQSKRRRR